MKNKRVKFTIEFEVDIDPVPGAFHDPEDWVNMVIWHFANPQSSYKPQAKVIKKSWSSEDSNS